MPFSINSTRSLLIIFFLTLRLKKYIFLLFGLEIVSPFTPYHELLQTTNLPHSYVILLLIILAQAFGLYE